MKPVLITLFAALAVSSLAPGQIGQQTPEEIIKLLPGPGVYLDTVTATPRFVALKATRVNKLNFDKKSQPQPIRAEIKGARATVRTTAAEPVFYVYGEKAQDLLLVALTARGNARDMESGTVRFDEKRRPEIDARMHGTVNINLQTLEDNLARLTAGAPLSGGEYALVRFGVFSEIAAVIAVSIPMGMGSKVETPVFDFGVDIR